MGKLSTTPMFIVISSGAPDEAKEVKTVFLLVIMLLNILGNVGVMIVVLKDRELRVIPRNIAFASLSLTDLLMVIVIILKIWTLYYHTNENTCSALGTLFAVFVHVSILHLFALSVDSYIAVFYPLSYCQIVTTKRIGLVLMLIWLISLVTVALLPLFMKKQNDLRIQSLFYGCVEFKGNEIDPQYRTFVYAHASFFFILPLTCMIVVYHKIAKVSWYQSNRVDVLDRGSLQSGRSRSRDMKWAKTIGLVIGAFTVCYLPIIVMLLYHASFGPEHGSSSAIQYLAFMDTVVNPIVYTLRNREQRKTLFKIFKRNSTIAAENGQTFAEAQPSRAAPGTSNTQNKDRTRSSLMESSTASSSLPIQFTTIYVKPEMLEKVLQDAIEIAYCKEK